MMSRTQQQFKSDGGLAYSQSGEGTPLLFIHGVGLCSESWYQQVNQLEKNYSVFTVDMPGHGKSDLLDKNNPQLIDFTDKIAELIRNVVKQPTVVIGHSMGAMLALSLAKEYSELCLAIIPMNAIYQRSEAAIKSVQQRALQLSNMSHADACAPISRWFADESAAEDKMYAELCRKWLSNANLAGYAVAYKIFAEEDGPDTDSIVNMDMPVLYITGEYDMNSNQTMTKAMAQITPKSEYLIVEGARHMMLLTHASTVNTAITNFLEGRLEKAETNF